VARTFEHGGTDSLTRPMVLAWSDWTHGKQIGVGDAHDFEMMDELGRLHVENLIDAQAARAVADLSSEIEQARGEAEQNRCRAAKEYEETRNRIAVAKEHEPTLPEPGDGDSKRRRGPGVLAYVLVLLVLYLVTLPADVEAALWSPLPPVGQWLLAVMIGAGMVVAAHWAAEKVEDLHQAWRAREDDAFLYRESQIAVVISLSLPVAVIALTAVWRGLGLDALERVTGGVFDGTAMNLVLAALALMVFAAAVFAGVAFRRARPSRAAHARERQARITQTQIQGEIPGLERARDRAQRSEAEATRALSSLGVGKERRLEAIEHWASERKARLRQRAAKVELAERRKLAHEGNPSPVMARRAGGSRSLSRNRTTQAHH
jgi:hypothetical protein